LVIGGIAGSVGGAAAMPAVPQIGASSYAAALASFEATQPRVTVNFDNGNSTAGAGHPQAAYSAGFSAFPPVAATAKTLYLASGGVLQPSAPAASSVSFSPDPAARPATTGSLPGFSAWAAQPNYNWTPVTGSTGAGFLTAPLASNLTVVGPASLNLWLKSTANDTDLQVTISEVRPSGQEIYVTSGFLRASWASTLNAVRSTKYAPYYNYDAAHRHLLTPNGAAVSVRVPIDPIAFTFRAGSRLRVTIEAPGGDRPSWAFGTTFAAGTTNTIALAQSALVLPTVASVTATDAQPACGTNRGQPCRTYVAAANGG
jgi:hypothetical protein